jgi:hypothetical protein
MARPKKEKKVEVPEESLSKVLSPGYTLEIQQDITAEYVGDDPELLQIYSPDEVEVKFGIIQFIRRLEGFDDLVYMQVRIDKDGTRKTLATYHTEDIQDAYALGCKVDSYLQVKNATDKYAFGVDSSQLKKIDATLQKDFQKFHSELESYGYRCRINFAIKDVMVSMHTNSHIAVLFEVIKKRVDENTST